jgi:hypothetical protein
MLYVTNAFSINMLPQKSVCFVEFYKLTTEEARHIIAEYPFRSYIGHADIAALASQLLGVQIEVNRETLTLQGGDHLLVIQYRGPRLPEGATQLPEGAQIEFWLAYISYTEDGGDDK